MLGCLLDLISTISLLLERVTLTSMCLIFPHLLVGIILVQDPLRLGDVKEKLHWTVLNSQGRLYSDYGNRGEIDVNSNTARRAGSL